MEKGEPETTVSDPEADTFRTVMLELDWFDTNKNLSSGLKRTTFEFDPTPEKTNGEPEIPLSCAIVVAPIKRRVGITADHLTT